VASKTVKSPATPSLVANLFDKLKSSPTKLKTYVEIPSTNILDDYGRTSFVVDESYFRISLSEMFLKDRREYWNQYLPFAVLVGEFSYDNTWHSIPIFIGKDLLKSIEKYIEGEYVEYRNATVLGPLPYMGGGLSLFLGLCRVRSSDLAEGMLTIVGDVAHTFDVVGLTRYLDIAAPLARGIEKMMGMRDVELRLGVRRVFDDSGEMGLRPSQFAYINSPNETLLPSNLWVKDGCLHYGVGKPGKRFTDADYCLLRIENLPTRDFSTLHFAKTWKEIKNQIWGNEPAKAAATFLSFAQEMATSPELTQRHRFDLMRLFKANFEKEVELHGENAPATRGRGRSTRMAKTFSARDTVQATLLGIREAELSESTRKGLAALVDGWNDIPHLAQRASPKYELDDSAVNEQLNSLVKLTRMKKPDPQNLLHAFQLAGVRASRTM
jgi:hypothetical protein